MIFPAGSGHSQERIRMEPLPPVRIDVHDVTADAVAIDSLARLALRLRRRGFQLELIRPSRELLELIELTGLADALPVQQLGPD